MVVVSDGGETLPGDVNTVVPVQAAFAEADVDVSLMPPGVPVLLTVDAL